MANEPNPVLEMLVQIRAAQERMASDIADLKARMTRMEQFQFQAQSYGHLITMVGGANQRLDRVDDRLARLESRLDDRLIEILSGAERV